METKSKKIKRIGKTWRWVGIVLLAVQLVTSGLVISELLRFPILPFRYMAALEIGLTVAMIATVLLLIVAKSKPFFIVGAVVSVLCIAGCLFALRYLKPLRKTMETVTGQEATETKHIEGVAVLVRAEDTAQKISDTEGYTYGVQRAEEYADSVAAYDYIVRTYNLKLTLREYEFYSNLGKALLNGEIRAMIADSAYVELLEEYLEGFAGHYKILGELSFDTQIERSLVAPTSTPIPTGGQPEIVTGVPDPTQGVTPTPEVTPDVSPEPTEPVTPTGEVTPTPTGEVTPTPAGPTKPPATPTPVITEAPLPDRGDPKDVTQEYFTVYFSGIDRSGSINIRSRSDVNIVMTVNPVTKRILLVSIPRDAYVRIPGVSGNSYDKLTHAGLYGVKTSMRTLENVYGITLDYYVRVNFTSVERFVSLLGGVDVYSAYAFKTSGGRSFVKGMNHVNGNAALAFVRERKSLPGGDYQRGRNQMELIKAIINKIQTPAILKKFDKIMSTISGNVQTSLSMDQLASLVRMQLDSGASWSVETYAVSASGGYEYCYSYRGEKLWVAYINWSTAREAANKMRAVMAGN